MPKNFMELIAERGSGRGAQNAAEPMPSPDDNETMIADANRSPMQKMMHGLNDARKKIGPMNIPDAGPMIGNNPTIGMNIDPSRRQGGFRGRLFG